MHMLLQNSVQTSAADAVTLSGCSHFGGEMSTLTAKCPVLKFRTSALNPYHGDPIADVLTVDDVVTPMQSIQIVARPLALVQVTTTQIMCVDVELPVLIDGERHMLRIDGNLGPGFNCVQVELDGEPVKRPVYGVDLTVGDHDTIAVLDYQRPF